MARFIIKRSNWFYLQLDLRGRKFFMYLDLYRTLNKRKVPYCQLEISVSDWYPFMFDSSKTLTLENSKLIKHHYDEDAVEVKRYNFTAGWLNGGLEVIYYD